jgi:hypothetical protein
VRRLAAMRDWGYSLRPEEERELLVWARLRNALSHRPPEQFRPAGIGEQDVLDYRDLLKSIYQRWSAERNRKSGSGGREA